MRLKCKVDQEPIPQEDIPYIKMELVKGEVVCTCLVHMSENEAFDRWEEVLEYWP